MNYYLTPSLDFQDGISGAKGKRRLIILNQPPLFFITLGLVVVSVIQPTR
jgi:hypothetical protein